MERLLSLLVCCLPAVVVSAQSSLWTGQFGEATGWGLGDTPRLLADIDGDGRADMVGFGTALVFVAFSTGTSFGPLVPLVGGMNEVDGWRSDRHVRTTADVNGDGRLDLVGFGPDGTYVALSMGRSCGPRTRWTTQFGWNTGWEPTNYPRLLGDVDGDGRADCICFGAAGVYVARSTGSSFLPAAPIAQFGRNQGWTTTNHVRQVADVNGDGRADIVGFGNTGVTVLLGSPSGMVAAGNWSSAFGSSAGWSAADRRRLCADVDGDGRADLVAFSPSGTHVGLSTGSGFAAAVVTSELPTTYGQAVLPLAVGDLDGDHRADFAEFGEGTSCVHGMNGGEVDAASRIAWEFGSVDRWEGSTGLRFVADVDGDGADDLVGCCREGVRVNTAKSPGRHQLDGDRRLSPTEPFGYGAGLWIDAATTSAGAPFAVLVGAIGQPGTWWDGVLLPLNGAHTFSGSMGTLDDLGDARVRFTSLYNSSFSFVEIHLDPVTGVSVSNWFTIGL